MFTTVRLTVDVIEGGGGGKTGKATEEAESMQSNVMQTDREKITTKEKHSVYIFKKWEKKIN